MLRFHATLDARYGFREHLYSLREVKGPPDCSKVPPSYCMPYLEHGVVVMTVGSQSGESQFETY